MWRDVGLFRDRVNLECDMIGKYVVRTAELAGLTLAPVVTTDTRK